MKLTKEQIVKILKAFQHEETELLSDPSPAYVLEEYYSDVADQILYEAEKISEQEPHLQQCSVSGSLPHDSADWENWDDAVAWAEVADELYQCPAKGESIRKLGQKYLLVKRQ